MKIKEVDCVCRPDPSAPRNPCYSRVYQQLVEGKFELTDAWSGWKLRGDGKLVGPGGAKFSPVHLNMLWKLRRDLLDAMIADAFDGPTVLKELSDRWHVGLHAANDDDANRPDPLSQAFLPGFEPGNAGQGNLRRP